MKDFLLSYDNVTLRPKYSTLKSRALADTSLVFGHRKFKLPVVPANMQDVIGIDNARWMSVNDYFYIMHRFNNASWDLVKIGNMENWKNISISVGVSDNDKSLLATLAVTELRIDFITVDVAHGHHENVKAMVTHVRKTHPNSFLICGNVATAEGAAFLVSLGVDAIKCGIGGGSICSTRYVTGFHLPTLQSVFEIDNFMGSTNRIVPIIADGGAKHYGDVSKALRFGATMVMSGSWFASCIDSPAKIVNGKKLYRGSTSYESKGEHKHIEGITLELAEGFTYEDRLREITQSLQSAISYAGGDNLDAFNLVEYHTVMT